jgi:quinol monooxygenase YgiN
VYGTVARVRLLPGALEEFERMTREDGPRVPGLVFEHLYRLDAEPDTVMLAIGFASREAYDANATSPEQQALYARYRALMAADPEWHDGPVVTTYPPDAASLGASPPEEGDGPRRER